MYSGELLSKLLERETNKPLKELFAYVNPQERLEKLLSLRPHVDRAAYAMFVRMSLQFNTKGMLSETILAVLNGLKQEDLMHQSEIDKLSRAIVNKHDVFAYFCRNCDEEEVLALITDNFTIL